MTPLFALAVDALAMSERDEAVQRLIEGAGGSLTLVSERFVGVPALHTRRLRCRSGVEIVLHDDAVIAVIDHGANRADGVDPSTWFSGADPAATLDGLVSASGGVRRFAGLSRPYLRVADVFVELRFAPGASWNEPGNLVSLTISPTTPGAGRGPEYGECGTCGDLLIREADGMDVSATIRALQAAVSHGLLVVDPHWVQLDDLMPLGSSRLMPRVESQLRCTLCRQIVCVTLRRDAAPLFEHCAVDEARRHRLEAIPPVELWGDEDRIAADRDALHHVDHEPGAWFLVSRHDELFLDARYNLSSMVDDSALIRLDESETRAYRAHGRDAVIALARRIADDPPHRSESAFHGRDLARSEESRRWRDALAAAIVNHTYLAERRR